MNTVLSEIKKWNNKYLRKLENHINALAVNLLDNSENTDRLERYIVLTLPDKPV
jgi:predicted RNase H-like nuclease (RuvC/YqgF family)